MTVNRRYVWAGTALAAILLVFLWWGAPERKSNVRQSAADPADPTMAMENHSHKHIRDDECAACPDLPLPPALGEKRERTPSTFKQCRDRLREAVENGNPAPDLSDLGGCNGASPLRYARTSEQVQLLLDNGANPNHQDRFGNTPLHWQMRRAVRGGTTDAIQKLLEAGSDPWITDNHGNLPIDEAHETSTASRLAGVGSKIFLNVLQASLKLRGTSLAEAEKNPEFKAMVEEMRNRSQGGEGAISLLIDAMAQTMPSEREVPEHLKEMFQ